MTRQPIAPDLYQSTVHPCPYLPEETAANLLIDPKYPVSSALYDTLIQNGFRRNGKLFYRPHCPACRQCQSVRIRVKEFGMNRNVPEGLEAQSGRLDGDSDGGIS